MSFIRGTTLTCIQTYMNRIYSFPQLGKGAYNTAGFSSDKKIKKENSSKTMGSNLGVTLISSIDKDLNLTWRMAGIGSTKSLI